MHRASRQSGIRAVLALAAALVLVTGAMLVHDQPSQRDALLAAAPAELQLPADPQQLGAWCAARQAQGTAGLTARARAWLADCITLFGSPAPSPSATQTPSPSPSPTVQPSPTVSPTATTPPATTPPGPCPVAGSNVPGGADPWGGCWPGPGNTGVPAGTVLTAYTGPCSITTAGTVIDSKTVTCATLDIRAAGVTIRNSMLQGVDVTDSATSGASFTIVDSTVVNGARDQCLCIGDHNFTALRVEVRGGNRSAYCARTCTVQDSWLHGQQLQGAQHGSGLREEQFTTAVHSVLVCDYPIVNDATSLGCSADLTGYPDFAPIHDNTIRRNLFLASNTVSFCAYGGATAGKPFSSDPANGTNQVFVENVFQRGANGKCGFYGPVTDFAAGRSGNVWSGNVWDNGAAVPAG